MSCPACTVRLRAGQAGQNAQFGSASTLTMPATTAEQNGGSGARLLSGWLTQCECVSVRVFLTSFGSGFGLAA